MAAVKEFSIEEKLSALVLLQKVDCKLDEIQILKGELPMEVKDLEDEIEGLHARQTRVEEEINGIQEFIAQKREGIKEADALVKKYEKQSDNVKNNREFEAVNKEIEMQAVERDSCGGCFHAIPPQKQSEIKLRKKIMVCENCGRILVDADLNDSVEVK